MTASPMETIAYSGGKVTLSCRVENYDVIPPLSWEKPDGSVLTFASKESRLEIRVERVFFSCSQQHFVCIRILNAKQWGVLLACYSIIGSPC